MIIESKLSESDRGALRRLEECDELVIGNETWTSLTVFGIREFHVVSADDIVGRWVTLAEVVGWS